MYEKKGRYIVEFPDIPTARQHQLEIPVEERRGNYNEVELGFDEERAREEARRCLSCRRCLGCALCWAECKPEAIDFEMEDEYLEIEADTVIISSGVEREQDRLDPRFGLGKYLNVVTDLQLERMLHPDGPSGGLVIRPYDGEIPATIAFAQTYESAAPAMHHAALCLGINEAILVRRQLPEVRIQVYAGDLDTFRSQYGEDLSRALGEIEIQEAEVQNVEADENQGLKLEVDIDGNKETRTCDLLVLMSPPQLSREVKELAKKLGLSVGYASLLAGEDGSVLLSTEKEGVRLVSQF